MIKRSAKRFLLNAENYNNFAARNPLIKQASNTPHSINKSCSEVTPRNPENSAITENDKTIIKIAPNNSDSNIQIETANIPHSLFALNYSTKQSPQNLINFLRIASTFQSVLKMSNSDGEILMQAKHSTPSKVYLQTRQAHQRLPQCQQHPERPMQILQRSLLHLRMIYIRTPWILCCPKYFQVLCWQAWIQRTRYSKRSECASTTELQYQIRSRMLTWRQFTQHTRKLGNDGYGDTCRAAVHASWYNNKNGKVQPLRQNW